MTSKERAYAIVGWWLNDKRCGEMGPGHLQTNLVDHIAQEIDAAVKEERERCAKKAAESFCICDGITDCSTPFNISAAARAKEWP